MSNRMLVLVGLPGSGKSTISNHLVKCKPEWKRVNQDDMKSRKACEMFTRKYLDQRHSVIVNRCNFDRDQRRTWINLAQHYKIPIDCIVLTANQQECGDRIKVREDHPTGVTGMNGIHILRRFVKNYHPPTVEHSEGFSRILYLDPTSNPVCTTERIDEIFSLLQECPLLIEEHTNNFPQKQKPEVDEDGWTTIPPTKINDTL
ncbi:unnamed protein product [Mucor hiemalis]